MKLSPKLKAWTVAEKGVKPDADDTTVKRALSDAMFDGSLTAEKFAELSITEEDVEADGVKTLLTDLGATMGEIRDALLAGTESGKGKKVDDAKAEEEEEEELPFNKKPPKSTEPEGTKGGKRQPSALEKMVSSLSAPLAVGDEKSLDIRVKEAADGYSTTKSAATYPMLTPKGATHPLAGRPLMDYSEPGMGGRPLDNASDLEKAVNGAYCKFLAARGWNRGSKSAGFQALPQHDKELLLYAMEKMHWNGVSEGGSDVNLADIKNRQLSPREQKALIDDSTSGGLEAAPIVFDDMVIQTPLLHGELYPLVNTIPLDRGRRIEGTATGTVTGSWGGVDDTAISLFNTASYVTAFDTTIFRWQGSVRIGLDFLSDTPIDFGQHVTAQYGERLLEDLDDVIATGDGTTQPEGISVKSGTTSISFGSAAATLAAYEQLRFGVAKPEHVSTMRNSAVFCGTEASYRRAMAIPVGASDVRRLSNTTNMPAYGDYSWMGSPYKINASLGNTKIFYAILARYRMYRRRGLTIRTSTEGDTLIRNNELLLVATARYGGALERGGCAAVTSSAEA